ncbi:hypothetical protein BWD42_07160 [Sphingobacterium sp. CZ-UAM]|uniref:sulfatase-like hydrolase/transferase n=1 Tax=Sphingobacterium sp. CZ-UAM TaxID=1933868 RepID=UPI000984FE76|nr:sulfatase-like hydrolase/transferase [Sphingobacterium sp. CZ-UAM]OOG19680.1 hypothetical protein BWD42_07160 [Sphingobacterium sp. CZ-UAM]
MKNFKILSCVGLCLIALCMRVQGQARPNILILLTDDQRYNTIRALGNNEVFTPNMDQLVHQGTAFVQAHIMGGMSGAICCPSRAMLMSSRSLFRLRSDGKYIPETDKTFPELFRENGYQTFATGKWHQDKQSFNRSFAKGDNIFFGGMVAKKHDQYNPTLHHYDSTGVYNQPFEGEGFTSYNFANAAIDFLKGSQLSEKPFLMYVAFTSPHDPRTPPEEYGHRYDMKDVSLPVSFAAKHPFDNGELYIRDEMLLPFPRTEVAVKSELAKYYGMVSEVDYQIGRIITELKRTGRYDNTIIILASDNGLAVGDHGLLGKQNPYESAIRVPLVFAGPGIPQDRKSDGIVYLNDIYPTLCTMAQLSIPSTVEGTSIHEAFNKLKRFEGRDQAFFAYSNIQRAIVRNGYKMILYNVKGKETVQLFNLKDDPNELHDLAQTGCCSAIIKKLRLDLKEEMGSLGDFGHIDQAGWGYPEKMEKKDWEKLNP